MSFSTHDNSIAFTYQGEKCPGEIDNTWITEIKEFLQREFQDKYALAVAKSTATCFIEDKEYSISRLDNIRRLYPMYEEFLNHYIYTINEAKQLFESKQVELNQKAEQFASEQFQKLNKDDREVNETEYLRNMKQYYLDENKIEFKIPKDGVKKAQKELERVTEMLGNINASKTNCNSNIVEPFELPEPIPEVKEGEPYKTAQEILCLCNSNSKLYKKLSKYKDGIKFNREEEELGSGPVFYIACILQKGVKTVSLYEKDIIQQFKDNIELLIKYNTILDRINLEVKFRAFDGVETSITEDLIRDSQLERYHQLIHNCETQLATAKNTVDTKNQEIGDYINTELSEIMIEYEKERSKYSIEQVDVELFDLGMEDKPYLDLIDENIRQVKLNVDDMVTLLEYKTEKYNRLISVGRGKEDETLILKKEIESIQKINELERDRREVQEHLNYYQQEEEKLQAEENTIKANTEFGLDISKYNEVLESKLEEIDMEMEEVEPSLSKQKQKMMDIEKKKEQNTDKGKKLQKSMEKKEYIIKLQEEKSCVEKYIEDKKIIEENKQETTSNLKEKVKLELDPKAYQKQIDETINTLHLPQACVEEILYLKEIELKKMIDTGKGSSLDSMIARKNIELLKKIEVQFFLLETLYDYLENKEALLKVEEVYNEKIKNKEEKLNLYEKNYKSYLVLSPGIEEFIEEMKEITRISEENKKIRVGSNSLKKVPCSAI